MKVMAPSRSVLRTSIPNLLYLFRTSGWGRWKGLWAPTEMTAKEGETFLRKSRVLDVLLP